MTKEEFKYKLAQRFAQEPYISPSEEEKEAIYQNLFERILRNSFSDGTIFIRPSDIFYFNGKSLYHILPEILDNFSKDFNVKIELKTVKTVWEPREFICIDVVSLKNSIAKYLDVI